MKSLRIIFRTCAVVNISHTANKRPFNLQKDVLILKCLKSLLESCSKTKNKIVFDIVDDSSGVEFIKKVENLLKKYRFMFKIHRINFKNMGLSLKYGYNLAEKAKEDIIYFCEDDYFHLRDSIPAILEAYETSLIGTSDFGAFLEDSTVIYGRIYPSYIFLGKRQHWRSIAGTPGTFFITRERYLKYKKYCYKFAEFNSDKRMEIGGEDVSLGHIWKEVPCIAPIPSLVAHLSNEEILPRFIDWKKLIVGEKI